MESKCPVFDLAAINSAHDAAHAYGECRENGSVVHSDAYGGYWAVIGYSANRTAATDVQAFCSGLGATIPALGAAFHPIPVEVDPPEHLKYRKFLLPSLRPDRVDEWRERMRAATDDVIDRFIGQGSGDLIEIAQYVPPAIIAEILGLPDQGPTMVTMTDELNRAAAAGDQDAKRAANLAMFEFVDKAVAEAEGAGREDLLGMIADAEIDGEPIGRDKAVAMAVTLVIAGHETTVNGIGSVLWLLGAHQEEKERLLRDRSRIPAAVEEALRLESPIQMMGRTATRDIEFQGGDIKEGDRVGLAFGAANLDPAKFPAPEKFDIDRDTRSHMAFGHGIHRCVGEHLARAEMQVAVERVLDRMPDYRLAGEIPIGTTAPFSRGPASVPVTFTPGERKAAR